MPTHQRPRLRKRGLDRAVAEDGAGAEGGDDGRHVAGGEVRRAFEDGLDDGQAAKGADEGPEEDEVLGDGRWDLRTVAEEVGDEGRKAGEVILTHSGLLVIHDGDGGKSGLGLTHLPVKGLARVSEVCSSRRRGACRVERCCHDGPEWISVTR